jgi:hypothetical protein
MPLPQFSPVVRVTANAARQDKIEYNLPLGIFRDTIEYASGMIGITAQDAAEYLGAPPRGLRDEANHDIAAAYSAFFTRPTGRGARQVLSLRQDPIPELTHDARFAAFPLCSGILNLQESGLATARHVTAVYWANLNPTRFVRYQNPNILRSGNANVLTPDLFGKYQIGVDGELAFDGSDNWIPEHPAAIWQAFTGKGQWPQRLTDYFSAVETAMRGEMNRRGRLSSVDNTGTLSFTPSHEPWVLRRVETYWEFANDSGAELIELVDRAMRSFCALPYVQREFVRPRRDPEHARERETPNAIVLSSTIAPGTRLVVYAKTNRRMRFEVRHDREHLRHNDPVERAMRSVNGVTGMVNALQLISEEAADVLNTFLNHLERTLSDAVIPWQASATDFLFKVAQHSKTAAANQVIVRSLMTEGAVSRTDALTPTIDALRRAGVLERVANRQRSQSVTFAPTPAYRAAVDYLAEMADVSRLTIARRQRPTA